MNDAISTLVKSVFQKESLHDCSAEELQTITRQYPYFTPAQLLLAEKLKSADDSLHKEQMQKLSLYFNNPMWLDYLVNGHKLEITVEPQNEALHSFPETTTSEERQQQPETSIEETPVNIESEPQIPEPVEEKINEPVIENFNAVNETITKEGQEHPTLIEEPANNIEPEQKISEPAEEIANQPQDQNISFVDKTIIDEEKQELPQALVEGPAINIEAHPEIAEQAEEKINEPGNGKGDSPDETDTEERQAHIEIRHEEMPINIELESKMGPPEGEIDEPEISIPLPDLKQEPTETELTFEPYHTVDYFASQGIKFVPEEKPADRFGQQLKSFTEWLKTMKRLPETERAKIPDVALEEKVQELADHSISEGDVVTETMAEVWLKQGNKEKAIETYNKLSLLNPSKSAYFASLVEQLKNS
jgi:hypothetical protein